MCDFCIDRKKIASGTLENIVALSVFEIVLETLERYEKRF